MNTRRALIASFAALAIGVGATCEDPGFNPPPEPPQGTPGGNHNPADRQPDPRRERVAVITVYVENAYLPAEVHVIAKDETGQTETWDEPLASNTYSQSLSYTSGLKIRIHVEVVPSRAGSRRTWCLIDDGPNHQDKRYTDGAWRVTCDLTTAR